MQRPTPVVCSVDKPVGYFGLVNEVANATEADVEENVARIENLCDDWGLTDVAQLTDVVAIYTASIHRMCVIHNGRIHRPA